MDQLSSKERNDDCKRQYKLDSTHSTEPDSAKEIISGEGCDKKGDSESLGNLDFETNRDDQEFEYVFNENLKSWQLQSKTGQVYYVWCQKTQAWNPPEESNDSVLVGAESVIPKTEVSVAEACDNMDEDGNKIFTDKDGTVFIWDSEKKAWFPKLDDNILLSYQMNYVFNEYQELHTPKPDKTATDASTTTQNKEETPKNMSEEKKTTAASWFEIDPNHNTKVYVSNLPLDITIDEFAELMSKCGLINRDADTNQLKIKLYSSSDGQLKGDGICDYIKMESVHLALEILDEYIYRDHKISVTQAEFKMRGNYNPALKPKRRKKNKEKLKKIKEKLFDWRPERMRGERAKHERIVIIKNYFTPQIFDEDVRLILEYQNLLREECLKCGTVNKLVLYDRHEEGIAQVNMSTPEEADTVIQMMDKRHFGKRQISASHWDGTTKYKSAESKNQEEERLSSWNQYLESTEGKETLSANTE